MWRRKDIPVPFLVGILPIVASPPPTPPHSLVPFYSFMNFETQVIFFQDQMIASSLIYLLYLLYICEQNNTSLSATFCSVRNDTFPVWLEDGLVFYPVLCFLPGFVFFTRFCVFHPLLVLWTTVSLSRVHFTAVNAHSRCWAKSKAMATSLPDGFLATSICSSHQGPWQGVTTIKERFWVRVLSV